jgi:hypothetical protein
MTDFWHPNSRNEQAYTKGLKEENGVYVVCSHNKDIVARHFECLHFECLHFECLQENIADDEHLRYVLPYQ